MDEKIKQELIYAVGETYSAIAPDVELMPDEEPEWAELVMDANRIEMLGDLSSEALATLKQMSWQERLAFADSCNYW